MVQWYGPWVGRFCSEWSSKSVDATGHPQWPKEGSFNVKCVEELVNQLASKGVGSSKAGPEQLRAALLWQKISHERKADIADRELCHLRVKLQGKKKEYAHMCPILERPPYGAVDEPGESDRGGRTREVPVPPVPDVPVATPTPPLPMSAPGPVGGVPVISVGPSYTITIRPGEDGDNIAISPGALPPTEQSGVKREESGNASAQCIDATSGKVNSVHVPVSIAQGSDVDNARTRIMPTAVTSTLVPLQQPLSETGGAKSKLALRRLESYNSTGLREEEELRMERLRSAARKAREQSDEAALQNIAQTEGANLNPMREVYRAPTDVSAEIHYPWAVWDLITLKEQSPNPELEPDKFVDYFLTALRAQKANWADTKVLLQKLISPAKFRDIMAFWDWGDDMRSDPTYPKRRDGTGNIAAGLAGNDARTAELVKDIKNAFPRKTPLQRLEKCVFEKGDTAYTFMDKTRDAFTHIMGAGAADDVAFKPFILSHYVNHLPPVVTQKIKAMWGGSPLL